MLLLLLAQVLTLSAYKHLLGRDEYHEVSQGTTQVEDSQQQTRAYMSSGLGHGTAWQSQWSIWRGHAGSFGLGPCPTCPCRANGTGAATLKYVSLGQILYWLNLGISEAPGVELPQLAAGINLRSS